MALRTMVETLDDVPEALHAEYREQDVPSVGKRFVLDVEGIDLHPAVKALKNAHDRTKADKQRLADELAQAKDRLGAVPEDFDPDLYARAKEAGENGVKIDSRLERQKADLEKKAAAERKPLEDKAARYERKLKSVMVDEGITRALIESGVAPEFMKGARALLKEKGAVRLVEDADDIHVFADDGVDDRTPLSAYVSKWATSEEGKVFIPKATGGDAKGGTGRADGPNPFAKGQENLTAQETLIRDNPNRARQLAQAAGVTPDW